MGTAERKALIGSLERRLHARVLVLITGDRQGMETKIAPDILPLISEHVSRIGATGRLALFLYTPGGDMIAGWGLVNLLREYCKKLAVVVPFRALSCGTLIALGADQIIMGRHGLLSPVDPSVASPFNPTLPAGQGGPLQFIPVSVEDLIGFLDLVRKEASIQSEAAMAEIVKILAEKVHPLALGAVYRAREQSSDLALRLLTRHMKDQDRAAGIVKRLTQQLPTHSYLIGRAEAKDDIKLQVEAKLPAETERVIWALYKEYEALLRLTVPASAEQDLASDDQKTVHHQRAIIESLVGDTLHQHVFVSQYHLSRVVITPPGGQTPVTQIAQRVLLEGWLSSVDGGAP